MPNDNITKEALPEFLTKLKDSLANVRGPGNFVNDWFVNKFKVDADGTGLLDKIHDANLAAKYRKAIEGLTPEEARTTMLPERIVDTNNVRAYQGEALNKLIGTYLPRSAAVGGAMGLWRQYDKFKNTRKALKGIPDYDVKEEEDDEKSAGLLEDAGSVGADAVDKLRVFAEQNFFGKGPVTDYKAAPMPYPGAMLGLIPAAIAGGIIGGDKLVDFTSDKLRAAAIRKRKEKLRKAFYSRILGGKQASADAQAGAIIDSIYDSLTMSKEAGSAGSVLIPGYATLLAALVGGGAFSAGYGISRGKDPLKAKAKALQLLLTKERRNRRYPVDLLSADTATAESMGKAVDSKNYSLPIVAGKPAPKDEEEDAEPTVTPNLQDLYALSKSSGPRTDRALQFIDKHTGGRLSKLRGAVNEGGEMVESVRNIKPVLDMFGDITPEQAARYKNSLESISKFTEGAGRFADRFKGTLSNWKGYASQIPSLLGSAAQKFTAQPAADAAAPIKPAPVAPKKPTTPPVAAAKQPVTAPPKSDTSAPSVENKLDEVRDLRKTTQDSLVKSTPKK